jgi:hypothetical protein
VEPIPGRPRILVIAADRDDSAARSLVAALRRRGLDVQPDSPMPSSSGRNPSARAAPANCIVLFGARIERAPLDNLLPPARAALLVATGGADEDAGAPFAAVVRTSAGCPTGRAMMLFVVKFLHELDLHSTEAITAEMLRFALFKALRIARRRYPELSSELSTA